MTGNDVSCIKTHLIVRCLREYNIKMHAKHRNQKFSKEGKISDLKGVLYIQRAMCTFQER